VTGHPKKEIKKKVLEILRWVGLEEREKDSILSLSTGEQQRVAVARALVNDPPLLLADEPTGNLDDHTTQDVMQIFTALHQKGTTMVFATQDKGLIQRYPHPVILLFNGRRINEEMGDEVEAKT